MKQIETIKIKPIDETVIDAMRLVADWPEARYFCFTRTYCVGCPFKGRIFCNRYSTDDIMSIASQIFRDYLEH